jgi:hypothetical protein
MNTQTADQPKKEKHLNREQRRYMERVNREAQAKLQMLVNLWYEFFMENDPAGEEVKEKQSEVSAKWKMYCKHRDIKPEFFSKVDEQCDDLCQQYLEIKNNKDEPASNI